MQLIIEFMRLVLRISAAIGLVYMSSMFYGCAASRPAAAIAQNRAITPEGVTTRPKILAISESLTTGLGLLEQEPYQLLQQQKLKGDGHDYDRINDGSSKDTRRGWL